MKKTDIAYLAGLVDGEAYIGIKKTKAYACQGRATPGYHARIQVRMVDEAAIKFLSESLGGKYYKERPNAAKGRPLYCFQASDAKAEHILKTLLPYLRVKRSSAIAVLEYRKIQCKSRSHMTKKVGEKNFQNRVGTIRMVPIYRLSDEYVGKCESLYLRCKDLNRVGV
jgi:hypothetical protein